MGKITGSAMLAVVAAVATIAAGHGEARAQAPKTLTVTISLTPPGGAPGSAFPPIAITSVTAGVNSAGTGYSVQVSSGMVSPSCEINTATLGDALLLRAQINSASTTGVTCKDKGAFNVRLVITSPPGANQSFGVVGTP